MAEKYPYTYAVRKIPSFLKHIRSAGIPQEPVSEAYLRKAGFTSSHDRSLVPVVKFLGLLQNDGRPSEHYTSYRDENTGDLLLGDLIRKAYKRLYDMHPDAHAKDAAAIRNFFKTDAKVSDEIASRMTTTFMTLCGQANFDGLPCDLGTGERPGGKENHSTKKNDAGKDAPDDKNGRASRSELDVCVNVQIVIPESADAEMIDSIFCSIARHLKIS